jgi:alpha-tubulin suppressor-like RCC1 family protein
LVKLRFRIEVLVTMIAAAEVACSVLTDLGPRKSLADSGASNGANDGGTPRPLRALRIAVGPTQACAIVAADPTGSLDSGDVRCWGSNRGGELGSDPLRVFMSPTPLPVAGFPSAASALTLAKDYACAVTEDQFLLGWGKVPLDPVVHQKVGAASYQPSEMDLFGGAIGSVISASVTTAGGCYTMIDQSLWCWGTLAQASIQNGRFTPSPGMVINADAFESVVAGRAHACGIARSGGTRLVECWGANDHEQAGVLNEPPDHPGPGRVTDPKHIGLASTASVVRVAAGGDTSCALFADGLVYCWGANDLEQLGIVDPRDRSAPTRIDLPAKATDIAVGDKHACARLETTNVWCWGDNSLAQLGNGPLSDVPSAPVMVQQLLGATPEGLGNARTIAAGGATTCAILDGDPRVWCWGANNFGQAGQSPIGPFASYATAVGW